MIRDATLADRAAILELVAPWAAQYPLRPDPEKIGGLLTTAISSPKHYCRVTGPRAAPRGVLIGLTGENLWAQRSYCNIVVWLSEIPGGGAVLLRDFRRWVLERNVIKVAGMYPDLSLDWRVGELAERCGFKQHGGAYLLYK